MGYANDVVIENGVLKEYKGPGGDVVIPEGVRRIGDYAFCDHSSLTSVVIPDGVTIIGSYAFYNCRCLTSVTIPASVTSVGDRAFAGCSLTSVTIPDSVTSIGGSAFYGCSILTSVTIPGSVTSIGGCTFESCLSLKNVTIPDSVTSIGGYAFYNCRSLTCVSIPDSVTSIGDRAFSGCSNLKSVTIPDSLKRIGYCAFEGCKSMKEVHISDLRSWCEIDFHDYFANPLYFAHTLYLNHTLLTQLEIPNSVTNIGCFAFVGFTKLQLVKSPLQLNNSNAPGCGFALLLSGDKPVWLAFAAKSDRDNLSEFAKPGAWGQYDLELINNGPNYKYKLSARLVGALGRLLDPVELTEENRALYAELLCKNAKKLAALAEETGETKIIEALFSLNILDDKTAKAVKKLLSASPVSELAALAGAELKIATPAPKQEKKVASAPASPLQAEYAAKLQAINGDTLIKKMKLIGTTMPAVKLANGTDAPEALFRFLLASYGGQPVGKYRFVPEADEAAKLLAYDSLCEAMDAVSGHLDGPNYPAVLPLLCRFGNAKQIRVLTQAWKRRSAQYILSDALVLSDTREAATWFEKNNSLQYYAALRGVSEEDIYERYLFDFGFDESGKRVFELGSTTIEATLTPDLKLALYDTAKNKAVKSIPKKGVDPAVQKKIADEVADIQQNLKKAAKIKADQLFIDYIDATVFPVEQWEHRYLKNPFLHQIASLLVWSQGGRGFIPAPSGLVDSDGNPYSLMEKPVCLVHPMEMQPEEITAWQKYFVHNGLKQPFQQIWEPVFRKDNFRMDRYKRCRINPVYLKSQQKRGIVADWYEGGYYAPDSKFVRITGFRVKAEDAPKEPGDQRQYLELIEIRPDAWNRRTNMVIAFLDRITMFDRIRKDDVSVMELMDGFTLAQITEFIKIAQEAQAVNVLALLLEYKNAHFADFDPMDEFTLE